MHWQSVRNPDFQLCRALSKEGVDCCFAWMRTTFLGLLVVVQSQSKAFLLSFWIIEQEGWGMSLWSSVRLLVKLVLGKVLFDQEIQHTGRFFIGCQQKLSFKHSRFDSSLQCCLFIPLFLILKRFLMSVTVLSMLKKASGVAWFCASV